MSDVENYEETDLRVHFLRFIKNHKVLTALLTFLLLSLFVIVGVKAYKYVTREKYTIDGQEYVKKDVTTILFMGIDNRGEIETDTSMPGKNGQADMLALIVLNHEDHSVNIITIPRETMVDVSTYRRDGSYSGNANMQLCLQYAYGTDSEDGCELTVNAVEGLLEGIKIDEYCAISMGAIDKVVEDLGGVQVTMTEDHWIPGYEYRAGDTVMLKDDEAYEFIHFRDTTEDGTNLDRMSRQKDFIRGLIDRLKQSPWEDISLFQTLYDDLQPYMTTSVTKTDILKLLWTGIWIREDDISMERISGTDIHVDEYDQYLVDLDRLHNLVLENFYRLDK